MVRGNKKHEFRILGTRFFYQINGNLVETMGIDSNNSVEVQGNPEISTNPNYSSPLSLFSLCNSAGTSSLATCTPVLVLPSVTLSLSSLH